MRSGSLAASALRHRPWRACYFRCWWVDELPRLDFYVPPTPELEVLPDTEAHSLDSSPGRPTFKVSISSLVRMTMRAAALESK